MLRCLLVVLVVWSSISASLGQQLAIVALPTPSHRQASAAIQLAITDVIANPELLTPYVLWISSNSSLANLNAIEAYLLANQSITSAFYLLDTIPGEDIISDKVAAAQVR